MPPLTVVNKIWFWWITNLSSEYARFDQNVPRNVPSDPHVEKYLEAFALPIELTPILSGDDDGGFDPSHYTVTFTRDSPMLYYLMPLNRDKPKHQIGFEFVNVIYRCFNILNIELSEHSSRMVEKQRKRSLLSSFGFVHESPFGFETDVKSCNLMINSTANWRTHAEEEIQSKMDLGICKNWNPSAILSVQISPICFPCTIIIINK